MTVTVPAKDTTHYEMFNGITTLNTTISKSTNGKQSYELTKLMAQKQRDLVLSLVASGNISPATVLSSLTYVASQSGGDAG